MAYRGRLIWPFLAELRQLDTAATAAGPPTPGYDADFREPVRVPDGSARGSHSARTEKVAIRLPCQVEDDDMNRGEPQPAGEAMRTRLTLVFHFRDLERLGMVDANGLATIRIGDRLAGIYRTNGALVQTFVDPPGVYATKVAPSGWGLDGLQRNLLVVTFEERTQGTTAT